MSRSLKFFLRLLATYLVVAGFLYFWAMIESKSGEEFAGMAQGILFDFWVVFFPIIANIVKFESFNKIYNKPEEQD